MARGVFFRYRWKPSRPTRREDSPRHRSPRPRGALGTGHARHVSTVPRRAQVSPPAAAVRFPKPSLRLPRFPALSLSILWLSRVVAKQVDRLLCCGKTYVMENGSSERSCPQLTSTKHACCPAVTAALCRALSPANRAPAPGTCPRPPVPMNAATLGTCSAWNHAAFALLRRARLPEHGDLAVHPRRTSRGPHVAGPSALPRFGSCEQ